MAKKWVTYGPRGYRAEAPEEGEGVSFLTKPKRQITRLQLRLQRLGLGLGLDNTSVSFLITFICERN